MSNIVQTYLCEYNLPNFSVTWITLHSFCDSQEHFSTGLLLSLYQPKLLEDKKSDSKKFDTSESNKQDLLHELWKSYSYPM